MYDMKKIVELAKEIGVEVNTPSIENENGLYFRNENDKLEKWDATSELDLNKTKLHKSQRFNNYFERNFYVNQDVKLSYSSYSNTDNLKDEFSTESKITKQSLISEAA